MTEFRLGVKSATPTPKKGPITQNGFWELCEGKLLSKMDTKFDPAKTQKKDPTVTPKKTQKTLQKPIENAILGTQNTEKAIKTL